MDEGQVFGMVPVGQRESGGAVQQNQNLYRKVPYPEVEPGYVSSSSSDSESSFDSDPESDTEAGGGGGGDSLDHSTTIDDSTVASDETSTHSALRAIGGDGRSAASQGSRSRRSGDGSGGGNTLVTVRREGPERQIVPFDPLNPVVLPLMTIDEAGERTDNEVEKAKKRIHRKKEREQERKRKEQEEAEEALNQKSSFLDELPGMTLMAGTKDDKQAADQDARPQSADVMQLAGFDPEKNYTNKELNQLAARATAIGKEMGLKNQGVGSLTYVDNSGKEVFVGRSRTRGLRRVDEHKSY